MKRAADYLTAEEIELRRSYGRKQRNGELDLVTDEERGANSKFGRVYKDLKAGRDPEREVSNMPSPAYAFMTEAEIELRRSYDRKRKSGDHVTDDERAAVSKYSRINADLRAGLDPERERRQSPAFAYMAEAEIEAFRGYYRKQQSGNLALATDAERAAQRKYDQIKNDIREGRDPEREVRVHGPSDSAEYFWSRIDSSGEGCWEWTRGKTQAGYGQVNWLGGKHTSHRVAFALANGFESPNEFPEGHEVDHMCRNTLCCRPDHLQLLTKEAHWVKSAAERSGEGHPLAKLTEEQAGEILWLVQNSDLTQAEIGLRYGVSHRTVSLIKLGKSWSHVQPSQPFEELDLELEQYWRDAGYDLDEIDRAFGRERAELEEEAA